MVDASDKRKYKRLSSQLNARVRKVKVTQTEMDEIQTVIKNISLGGVFIETNAPFDVNTVVKLNFKLPCSDRELEALGIVRWVSNTRDVRGMGIQFLQVTTEDKTVIKEHVTYLERKKESSGQMPAVQTKNEQNNPPDKDAAGGTPKWH